MDGNVRLTLIILGMGLMAHAGYVYYTCEMMSLFEYIAEDCDAKKEIGGYEFILGIALFLGMIKAPKKN